MPRPTIAGDLPPSSSVTGREVRRRRRHHLAADRGRSREQQVVEGQRHERAREVGAAVEHREHARVDLRRDEAARAARPCAGAASDILISTRLPAASAPVSRTEGEVERIVPGHHDADHAERLEHHARAPGQEPEARRRAAAASSSAPGVGGRGGCPRGRGRSRAGVFPPARGHGNPRRPRRTVLPRSPAAAARASAAPRGARARRGRSRRRAGRAGVRRPRRASAQDRVWVREYPRCRRVRRSEAWPAEAEGNQTLV